MRDQALDREVCGGSQEDRRLLFVDGKTREGHTLVVCEKPDAARRVADALSGGRARPFVVLGTTAYRLRRGVEEFVVCSALGHVYSVSDPFDERVVFPVFDTEWYPSDLVEEGSKGLARRVAAIRSLAAGAKKLINACDFDVEGETIGFNVLRYACEGREEDALRAKFSTLTVDDIVAAFDGAEAQRHQGLAAAGRARHVIDFAWGVNLSRVLSRSALRPGRRYATISMGRVQGPTLGFLHEREVEVRQFVPVPFWKVAATFRRGDVSFEGQYSREGVPTLAGAEEVQAACAGREGTVTKASRGTVLVPAPPAFNLGDLQKEAYRHLRLPPSRTSQAAERLYLAALISYPRTESQRLPPSIGYPGILKGLGRSPEYSKLVAELTRSPLRPAQGQRYDPAHPAIYPTGGEPGRALRFPDGQVYDLVVRRFLAAFGPAAKREVLEVEVSVGEHRFRLSGGRTLEPGWQASYGRYARSREAELPSANKGDSVKVESVDVEEKTEQAPRRYDQASLLERMERDGIGTKATRAEIISTLVQRGYVGGEKMEVTELGFSVVEAMRKYAPQIVSPSLTKEIEEELGRIEASGSGEADILRDAIRTIAEQLIGLTANGSQVGDELDRALRSSEAVADGLGPCPVCKTGTLKIIRSAKTKKRFVGCSNYRTGCIASSPLPQRGAIRRAGKACRHCSWPEVYVSGGRTPWRLCVNIDCPGRKRAKK
ncbi:MAG: DNA topoisomerase I [archaeon]|nr:MAG: DNA topoisomerase I [archaeon]